ncbi:hypothetical protein I552_4418 [Mycobacterium xenopi 3993]|nr:hypothetical protein I552_4418 [Mycobacterium xenopi 3993]
MDLPGRRGARRRRALRAQRCCLRADPKSKRQRRPRPVEPLFGYHHWLGLFQIFTIISMSIIIAVYVVTWRRHPGHPFC